MNIGLKRLVRMVASIPFKRCQWVVSTLIFCILFVSFSYCGNWWHPCFIFFPHYVIVVPKKFLWSFNITVSTIREQDKKRAEYFSRDYSMLQAWAIHSIKLNVYSEKYSASSIRRKTASIFTYQSMPLVWPISETK